MTQLPPQWAFYARMQHEADRTRTDNRYWATDEAADLTLELLSDNQTPPNSLPSLVGNAVTNRRAKHRRRAQILHEQFAPLQRHGSPSAVDEEVFARDELLRLKRSLASADWTLLLGIAHGQPYAALARERATSPGALKMRVSRLRKTLLN